MISKHEDTKGELSATAFFLIVVVPAIPMTILVTIFFGNTWTLFVTLPSIVFVTAVKAYDIRKKQKYIAAFEDFIIKEFGGVIPEEMYSTAYYIHVFDEPPKRRNNYSPAHTTFEVPMPGKGVNTSINFKDDAITAIFSKLNPWLAVNHPGLCQREMLLMIDRNIINLRNYISYERN